MKLTGEEIKSKEEVLRKCEKEEQNLWYVCVIMEVIRRQGEKLVIYENERRLWGQ